MASVVRSLLIVIFTGILKTYYVSAECSRSTPPCKYECHCAWPRTRCSTTPAQPCKFGGTCASGWSGSTCQRKNVLLGREGIVNSSTILDAGPVLSFTAIDRAFDGNLSTTYNTGTDRNDPYLWIKLEKSMRLRRMKLYTTESGAGLIRGFQVDVSSELNFSSPMRCYTDTSAVSRREHDITCGSPLDGQYVRLMLQGNKKQLVVSELEIYSCTDSGQGGIDTTCISRCPDNIDGTACSVENVARGRSNDDTAVYKATAHWPRNYIARAFDGETSWDNVAYFSYYRRDPYLWVKLQEPMDIYKMKLYTEDTFFLQAISGFYVDVSSDWTFSSAVRCYTDQSTTQRQYDIMCSPHIPGQYVRLTVPGRSKRLAIIELEIYRCADYWYGGDCDKACNCRTRDEICHKVTGKCQSGCPDGFEGQGCQQPCGAGRYGEGCNSTCGNCEGGPYCNNVDGSCPNGCTEKFDGDLCKECADGRHGPGCDSSCGKCLNAEPCDKKTGSCPNGCDPGYQSPLCTEAASSSVDCVDGYYGPRCTSQCGNCLNDALCNKTSGHCTDGCAPGFQTPLCETKCTNGKYGPGCTQSCGKCANSDPCHAKNGNCPRGCDDGYQPPLCHAAPTQCENGRYGPGCTETCGNCADSEPCDKMTGRCPRGCKQGFKPPFCKLSAAAVCSPRPGDGGPATIHIGAFVAVVVLLLAAFVVVAVLLWKCRQYRRFYREEVNKRYVTYKVPADADDGKPEVVYEEMPK